MTLNDHSNKDWLKIANTTPTSNFSWWLVGVALGVIICAIVVGYVIN